MRLAPFAPADTDTSSPSAAPAAGDETASMARLAISAHPARITPGGTRTILSTAAIYGCGSVRAASRPPPARKEAAIRTEGALTGPHRKARVLADLVPPPHEHREPGAGPQPPLEAVEAHDSGFPHPPAGRARRAVSPGAAYADDRPAWSPNREQAYQGGPAKHLAGEAHDGERAHERRRRVRRRQVCEQYRRCGWDADIDPTRDRPRRPDGVRDRELHGLGPGCRERMLDAGLGREGAVAEVPPVLERVSFGVHRLGREHDALTEPQRACAEDKGRHRWSVHGEVLGHDGPVGSSHSNLCRARRGENVLDDRVVRDLEVVSFVEVPVGL